MIYRTQAAPCDKAKNGAAYAVQSFGDFQNFNTHLHLLATSGCFYNDIAFMVCPPPDKAELVPAPPRRDFAMKITTQHPVSTWLLTHKTIFAIFRWVKSKFLSLNVSRSFHGMIVSTKSRRDSPLRICFNGTIGETYPFQSLKKSSAKPVVNNDVNPKQTCTGKKAQCAPRGMPSAVISSRTTPRLGPD